MKGKVQKRDIYFRLTTKQTTSNTVLAVIIELTNITYSTSERRKIQTKKNLIFKIKMVIDEYVYFLPPYHKCYDTHTFIILRMYNIKYKNNITYFTRNNIIYSFIYMNMNMNVSHHHGACLYNSELRHHKFKFMLKS